MTKLYRDQRTSNTQDEGNAPPQSTGATGTGPPADNVPTEPPIEPLPVEYNVYVVDRDKKVEPFMTTVKINGATLQMEMIQTPP